MTCAPRIISSPTSPGPSTLPASSSIHASVPGIGTPTEVGRASSWSGGRYVARLHSVSPYIEYRRAFGNVRRIASMVAAGSTAAVFVRYRSSGNSRSARPRSERRTWKTVGTPGQPRDPLGLEELHDSPREGEALLEDERRAHPDAHQQLVEAVVEREREDAEDAVRLAAGRGTRRSSPRRRSCCRA